MKQQKKNEGLENSIGEGDFVVIVPRQCKSLSWTVFCS